MLAAALLPPVAAVHSQEAVDSLPLAPEPEVYVPAPELSPSTYHLRFSGMRPGESRTLFMDLANIGDGLILIDSLLVPDSALHVRLPERSLQPGRFIRFPVAFTQVGLDTHRLLLVFYWRSPRFEMSDTLGIRLTITPGAPLSATPAVVRWEGGVAGLEHTARVVIRNESTLPVNFPRDPEVPLQVGVTRPPQVLAGGRSTWLIFSWRPVQAGRLDSSVTIPYNVGATAGTLVIPLQAEVAAQPIRFESDTVDFDRLFVGSPYRRDLLVVNRAPETVILRRRWVPGGGMVPSGPTGVEESDRWIEAPPELELPPGEDTYIDLVVTPRGAGRFLVQLRYLPRIPARPGRAATLLPEVAVILTGEAVPPVSINRTVVDFGAQPVLLTTMQSLGVANRGAVPIGIDLRLGGRQSVFATPPLTFTLAPRDSLEVPLYFRPEGMVAYRDTLVIRYTIPAGSADKAVSLAGRGLDRPLQRLAAIPDAFLTEDFEGWQPLAKLDAIFADANHAISFRLSHSFGAALRFSIDKHERLLVSAQPNYHGRGEVIVRAVNEIGQTVADTFRLSIAPINDLPYLARRIPDLVLKEDARPLVVGRLSEIFLDPDRALDTVVTHYRIYGPADDSLRLNKRGDELVLIVAPDWHGNRSFVVAATDAADTSVAIFSEFSVRVLPVNDPPSIEPLPGMILFEDDTLHINWGRFIRDRDHRREELTLTVEAVDGGTLPVAFHLPGAVLAEEGAIQVVVEPRRDWFGRLEARLVVTDPDGAVASAEFPVTVVPRNDPPGRPQGREPITTEWEQRLIYTGRDTLVTFRWTAADDPDPLDELLYTWVFMDTTGRVLRELPAGTTTELEVDLNLTGVYLWAVRVRDSQGALAASDTLPVVLESRAVDEAGEDGELVFSFGPNYPNPFSELTHIDYTIPRYADVTITVYDAMGRRVRVLRTEPHYRGRYTVSWDGRDAQGQTVASGPYVVEIRAGIQVAYLKVVVVR